MIQVNEKFYPFKEKLKFILNTEELEEVHSNSTSLIDFGFEYIELGDYDRAFDLFMINLKLNGNSADALNGVAISLLELGNPHAAQEILEKTIKLYPHDAVTLANMAGIYWENDQVEKAVYYYNKSLKVNNKIVDTHFNLINLYYETADLFMAYISCLNLLSIAPNNKQARTLSNELLLDLGISMF
jgi:tetratricopeptide (TPR) repeat protein